jgi:hypothetical protein
VLLAQGGYVLLAAAACALVLLPAALLLTQARTPIPATSPEGQA